MKPGPKAKSDIQDLIVEALTDLYAATKEFTEIVNPQTEQPLAIFGSKLANTIDLLAPQAADDSRATKRTKCGVKQCTADYAKKSHMMRHAKDKAQLGDEEHAEFVRRVEAEREAEKKRKQS